MIKTFIAKFRNDEDGVTAVEYGVLAVLIVGILIFATASLQTSLKGAFDEVGERIGAIK